MRRGLVSAFAIAAVSGCLWAPGASAAGTLDQQQLLTDGVDQVQSGQSLSQTITAGITGGMDQVDLSLGCGGTCPPTAPLTVEIRNVVAGLPGTTVLATSSVPATAVSPAEAFLPITFATPVPVTAGTQYAIVAYSATATLSHFTWASNQGAPYAAGVGYFASSSPPTTAWGLGSGFDTTFKTYVTKPVVAPPLGPTGQRTAALKKCAKKKSKAKRKKCRKRARQLPV